MRVCCVDIGKGGGFAWIEKGLLGLEVKVHKMPDTIQGINKLIQTIDCDAFAIEDVRIRPQDFEDGRAYRMIDVMIRNVHELEAILKLNNKPYFKVVPQRWQYEYKERIKGLEYSDKKRFFRHRAQEIFTKVKVTAWSSDALLILNYVFVQIRSKTDWIQDIQHEIKVKLF